VSVFDIVDTGGKGNQPVAVFAKFASRMRRMEDCNGMGVEGAVSE
jgi:hypothetical protein